MRNKKLIVMIVVLLLAVFTLSIALVACVKTKPGGSTNSGNPNPGPGPSPGPGTDPGPILPPPAEEEKPPVQAESFRDAMAYIFDSMPSEYMSLNFEGYATIKGKKYRMTVKGNMSDNDFQLSAVFKSDDTGKIASAIYVVNSRLFIQVGDDDEKSIYNIAEIDVNYLLSIVDKLPDAITELLKGIDLGGLDIMNIIDLAIGILTSGLSSSDDLVYEVADGVEKFELPLNLQGMLDPLIGMLDKDGLVGMFLPADLNLDLTFVAQLLSMVPLINGSITATVDNGRLTEFNLELLDNDPESESYKQPVFGLENAITFGSEPLELDIPDELDNYQSLTLGNLNFDLSLDLNTGNEPFDIGALIDSFLDKKMFGEGVLVLNAHANYGLDIKASLDPDLYGSQTDNNYINIMLYAGENELVRANYLDGYLYVKALGDGVNGFAEGGINIAIKLPLKEYIAQLVKLITGYIDGFLGTQFRPTVATVGVLSSSINRDGEMILSPSLQEVITGVMKLLDLQECIDMEGGDHITVIINEKFFEVISKLAKVDINYPIFGEFTIGLFKGGIEYIEVSAMNILTFRADNFGIGKAKITREDVQKSIGDTQNYGTDIESIILTFALNLLSDLDISMAIDLSTVNTTVNLTSIINNIMAMANNSTYLKFPIALDLSKYQGTFNIRLATNYNEETGDGRVLIEVITPDGDTLIAAYNENSNTYVDLSGLGFMKFCLANVDIFKLLRGMLGKSDAYDELLDEVESDIFTSSGVEIEGDSLGVALDSYFITLLMRMLSMDLGIDADFNAELNMDGSVNAELDLGIAAKLGLRISLGKESESAERGQPRIEEAINNLAKLEFGVYNAVNAEMLVDSILAAENLNFTIDLYNQNVDYSSHENKTRIVIRRSTAAEGKTEVLGNGLEAPYKSIVVALYNGWITNENNAILYAYLDIDGKKVQFKGTDKMLNVDLFVYQLTGEVLNIGIDADIKTSLINALSGLFGESGGGDVGNSGGAIEVPDGALPTQKPSVTHKCRHKCEVCGNCLDETCKDEVCANKCNGVHETTSESQSTPIEQIIPGVTITLTGKLDIDVDLDINGVFVSKFLKDTLSNLFTNLDLGDLTGEGPVTLNYDNVNPNTFFDELYDKVLIPLIKKQVGNLSTGGIGNIVGSIAGNANIKNQVHALVQRFLPLPNVEDLKVNVSLTDGKLANITAIGSNSADYDDPEDSGNNRRTNLGFGIYIFNAKANEVVSWENQATSIYFNRTFGLNLMDMFEENVRVHTKSNWEVDSFYKINWTLEGGGMDLATFSERLALIDPSNPSYIADGVYVFVGTANATEISKRPTLRVTLTLDSLKIQSIKDMEVKAMRDVPTYVTATFGQDKEGNEIERLLTHVDINLPYGRVNGENNASVTIGGEVYNFTIHFEDEGLTLDTLQLNAYDYIDKLNALEKAGTIRVKVNNSFYRNLPATFNWTDVNNRNINVKNITRTEAQVPAIYTVNVHVGEGTIYEQDLLLNIEFKPFDIYYIERNELNYIETDYLEYVNGESFPEEITVVGYNGEEWLKYTANVKWDTSAVKIDLKGGQYFASAIINEGDYNQWVMEGIEVNVVSTDIVALASSSRTTVFDWKYCIYGGVDFDKCITSVLNFVTSDRTIKRNVPVTIDISGILNSNAFADAMNGIESRIDCPVSIDVLGEDGKSLFETTVTVIVPSIKMSLLENEITIDVSDKNFEGLDEFFNARSNMEILLGDDTVTANVTWVTDDVIVNEDGEYKVRVYIDRNGDYEQYCTVTVNITGNNVANDEEV